MILDTVAEAVNDVLEGSKDEDDKNDEEINEGE